MRFTIQVNNRLPEVVEPPMGRREESYRQALGSALRLARAALAQEVTIADVLSEQGPETECAITTSRGSLVEVVHTREINVQMITSALVDDASREDLERVVQDVVNYLFTCGAQWRDDDDALDSAADFVDAVAEVVDSTTLGKALKKARTTL